MKSIHHIPEIEKEKLREEWKKRFLSLPPSQACNPDMIADWWIDQIFKREELEGK